MNLLEFERALRLGLGRAVLEARDSVGAPIQQTILDACLHNLAYDPQVEGSRAQYMFDVMCATGDLPLYADRVVQSLDSEEREWDTAHRFGIARLLAQGGDSAAREAMYSAFCKNRTSSSDIAAEFIELDGLQGFLFVAGRIGVLLGENPARWEDDYLLSIAREKCGNETVDTSLAETAATDRGIKAYLSAVEKNRALRAGTTRPDPKNLAYRQVRSLIESKQAGGLLREWAVGASNSDLELAAHDLIHELDPDNIRSLLVLFRKRPFPLEIGPLFQLLDFPDGPIPFHTLAVLANLEHESIRTLAFKLIETESRRSWAIDLLVKNFREDDFQTVEAWCDAERDPATINAFDRSLRGFFSAHPNPDTEKRLLIKMYEKEPCAHCRSSVVERLIELNGLPHELTLECKFDSYVDTRLLVNAGASARESSFG